MILFTLRGVTDGDKGLGWLGGATKAQCKCPCSEISNWKVQVQISRESLDEGKDEAIDLEFNSIQMLYKLCELIK